jgi:hypothetical protein
MLLPVAGYEVFVVLSGVCGQPCGRPDLLQSLGTSFACSGRPLLTVRLHAGPRPDGTRIIAGPYRSVATTEYKEITGVVLVIEFILIERCSAFRVQQ